MAKRTDWRASQQEIEALAAARHGDPFAVLGPHRCSEGVAIRAFAPQAAKVEVLDGKGQVVLELVRRDPSGVFEGLAVGRSRVFPYRLRASNDGGSWTFDDPYRYGPVLGPLDDHLLVEGSRRSSSRTTRPLPSSTSTLAA